jgi:hypothetical protein
VNVHLEESVSTKAVRRGFQESSIHGRAAIGKHLIAESNVQKRKGWCHDYKTWISDNGKRALFPKSDAVF